MHVLYAGNGNTRAIIVGATVGVIIVVAVSLVIIVPLVIIMVNFKKKTAAERLQGMLYRAQVNTTRNEQAK